MTYDEIEKIIRGSDAEDWLYSESRRTWVYKNDINLSISEEEMNPPNPFSDSWATVHPNPHAYEQIYSITYGGSFIKEETLVVVDGGRATLPIPIPGTSFVDDNISYAVAKIIDETGTLTEYMERSRLRM
jgi:hypothetical protein